MSKLSSNKMFFITVVSLVLGVVAFTGIKYGSNAVQAYKDIPELQIPMPGNEMPDISITSSIDDYSSMPKEAMVYKFKPVNNTETDVKNLIGILGLSGDLQTTDEQFFINDGKQIFGFNKSTGNWHVYYADFLDQEPGEVPSEEQCIKIAQNFLRETGFYNERFTKIVVTTPTGGGNTEKECKVLGRRIIFYPEINGIPVYGVSRISVLVGNNGTIVEVFKTYKDFDDYEVLKLKDPSIAINEVLNKETSINLDGNADVATITGVKLGYWEDAGSVDEQPYLQPVWIYWGEATLIDGNLQPFDAVVPALEQQ